MRPIIAMKCGFWSLEVFFIDSVVTIVMCKKGKLMDPLQLWLSRAVRARVMPSQNQKKHRGFNPNERPKFEEIQLIRVCLIPNSQYPSKNLSLESAAGENVRNCFCIHERDVKSPNLVFHVKYFVKLQSRHSA
jgi:hypothetical protein